MISETLREDSTTKMSQSNMKKMHVTQAQSLGPPSSAPNVRRLNTSTAMQATEVEKNTSNEKLRPAASFIFRGSLYAMKLYAVFISHGTPIPTYMFTELLQICQAIQLTFNPHIAFNVPISLQNQVRISRDVQLFPFSRFNCFHQHIILWEMMGRRTLRQWFQIRILLWEMMGRRTLRQWFQIRI